MGGSDSTTSGRDARPALSIRTPLMAFATVSRRTGVIRKRCLVQNDTGAPVELEVHRDFPEHSWLQLVVGDGATPAAAAPAPRRLAGALLGGGSDEPVRAAGDLLVVPPGESNLDVLLDTDNSNFPFGSFRGQVELRPVAGGERRHLPGLDLAPQFLTLSFEEIVELEDFDGYAAIDLGTNGATIAVYHRQHDAGRGETWNPELDRRAGASGASDVPAAVLLRDINRFRELTPDCCVVGRRALAEYRELVDCDPHALLLGTKRHLGRRRVLAADLRGGAGYVAPEDAIYQLGRHVREQCQNHPRIQARLPRLTVTYPPTWDQRQLDRWKEVFRRLGYRDEDLDLSLDEASAVGLFYLHRWTLDADRRDRLLQDLRESRREIRRDDEVGEEFTLRLLCFDFGGGTIDLAHVEARLELFGDSLHIRLELVGSDSLDYGGDQVTLTVFRILKRRIALALADPDRFAGGGSEAESSEAPAFPEPAGPGLFLLPGSSRGSATDGEVDGGAAHLVRDAWDRIQTAIASPSLGAELDDAVDRLFPTRFRPDPDAPLVAAAKRNFAWLWDRAEALKRELFRAAQLRARDVALSEEDGADLRMGVSLAQLPDEVAGRPLADHPASKAQLTVGIDEIYGAIREPLREAVARARRLVGSHRPDRIVLAGQSSWIPLVRQLFARPRSEGGLGLAPGKIEFDPEHAKTAVSRGACLLPVMRDALVGVSVDVSAFRVALLRDIYYKSPMGRRRELFRAGPIRDLEWAEDTPDPKTFARYLTVFSGDRDQVLGQFDFGAPGQALPDWRASARRTAKQLDLDEAAFPTPQEVERLRTAEPEWARRLSDRLATWPETELVAWMESDAAHGTPERPLYRYYLTRSRQLLAVRDRGEAGALLHRLDYAAGEFATLPPEQDPFAGVH